MIGINDIRRADLHPRRRARQVTRLGERAPDRHARHVVARAATSATATKLRASRRPSERSSADRLGCRCDASRSSPRPAATARPRWGGSWRVAWASSSSSSTRSSTARTGPRRPTTSCARSLEPILATRRLGDRRHLQRASSARSSSTPPTRSCGSTCRSRVWLPRLVRRTRRRISGDETIWNDNRESWRDGALGLGLAVRATRCAATSAAAATWPRRARRATPSRACAPPPKSTAGWPNA